MVTKFVVDSVLVFLGRAPRVDPVCKSALKPDSCGLTISFTKNPKLMEDGDDDASVSETAQNQPEPSMFGDSQPDNAAPQVVSASEHSQHPFFAGGRAASRGRGGGGARGRGRGQQPRGGGGGGGAGRGGSASASAAETAQLESNTAMIVPDSEERPLFGPISLKELEFAHRRNADGAESAMWSDDDDDEDGTVRKKKKRKNKARSSDPARSRPRMDANDEDAMAAAAFGGGGEEEDEDDGEEEDDDEYGEGEGGADDRSEARESSVADGGSRLLPIRGETCVGCVCDRSVIQTVDAFVRQNAVCMTETALYKAAALHYRNEIVIPRRREGVRVLPWNWKDLQVCV